MKITTAFLPCVMILGISALAMPPPPQTSSSNSGTQPATQVVETTTTSSTQPTDHGIQTTTTKITTFRVNVVSRTVQAVNYRHRGGATKLNFAGTDLMPSANGEAKVESKKGYIEIEVEFGNLRRPTSFGNEYLTYVMWAISPEGRAVNLGEVLVGDNDRSKLDVTTDLQAFALIVTAEPYYAVRQPSNVVVLENVVRDDTKGTIEAMNTKYDLLERGGYVPTGYQFDPVVLNANLPLEFFEARNALHIAQSVGAETYASSSYQHAANLMNQADGYATSHHIDKKQLIAVSRETVQTAEDAREITVKKRIAEHQSNQLQASAEAVDDATRQKELAQSDAAKAKSDMERSQANSANQVAAAQADTEQARLAANQATAAAAGRRKRQSSDARPVVFATECHPANARQRTWVDCQHVGCLV